jgi:hypothetical protein
MAAWFAESLSRTFCWMSRCSEGDFQARGQRSLMRTGINRFSMDLLARLAARAGLKPKLKLAA